MKQGRQLREAKAKRVEKKRKARRLKRAVVLSVEVFVFVCLLSVGYLMEKYGKFQVNLFNEGEVKFNEGVEQEHYTTIALFGGDSREGVLGAGTHADTMMLVSINDNTKEIRIVSVYRDLLTKQQDGSIRKANSAYFVGGAKDAINMLNENFDLDIEDYITVDFGAVVSVVDLLEGIEVDVKEDEAAEMNNHIEETARIAGQKAKKMEAGLQTLNGVETVTYARIRKNVAGGDYSRTERQRLVIHKLLEKLKAMKLTQVNDIVDEVFGQVETSLSLEEMLGLASGIFKYELTETNGFPFKHTDGNIEGIGSVVIPIGVIDNVKELHTFLYPKSEYKVSKEAKAVAEEIEELICQTKEDTVQPDEGVDN